MSIPNAKKFQPGQSGNPKGGSKKASLKKKIKEMSAPDVADLIKLILCSPLEKLEEVLRDAGRDGTKQHSALVTYLASLTVKGTAKADPNILRMLLDASIGKVPTPMQLTSPDGSMRPTVILELPDNGFRVNPELDGQDKT